MLNLKKLEEEGLGLLLLDTDVDEGAHGRRAAAIPGWLREVLYSFSQFGDCLEWMGMVRAPLISESPSRKSPVPVLVSSTFKAFSPLQGE